MMNEHTKENMMGTEHVPFDIERIIAECDKERAEYAVYSGQQVSMGVHGKFIVSSLIIIEQCFLPKNVWKLFSLIDLGSGLNWNWTTPVPVMTEGTIDIRKIVGVGEGKRVQELTYVSGAGTDTRKYKAVERDGFTFTITVKGLLR
jgi:hypothetical protein